MSLKLNPLYKKLMLLTLILGPMFWLVMTEDGQRRADLVLISVVKDTEAMDVSFAKLRSSAIESDILGNFPEVSFSCEDHNNSFGDRVCASLIASFNGAPASHAAVFFRAGQLSAVKMTYEPSYHNYVIRTVRAELGAPTTESIGDILRWNSEYGSVLMSKTAPEKQDEPTVVWIAVEQMARPAGAS